MSPTTRGGQSFTVAYALIGIPLCAVVLGQIGTKANARIKLLLERISLSLERYETKAWVLPAIQAVIITIFLLGFSLLIPAAAFSVTEGWSYHEAWYYCFITLTTIGFGDFVIGTNSDIPYSIVYKWFSFLWIFFGLIVMATIISKATDWLSYKTENAKIFNKTREEMGKEEMEMGSDNSHGKLNGDGQEENGVKSLEMTDVEMMNKVQNGQD